MKGFRRNGPSAHELQALAAIRVLFTWATYRYASDANNLAMGWQVTFQEPMPLRPSLSIVDPLKRAVRWDLYIDGEAPNFLELLKRIRIVKYKKGNQFELRALDPESLRRVLGPSLQTVAEIWLAKIGIILYEDSEEQNEAARNHPGARTAR